MGDLAPDHGYARATPAHLRAIRALAGEGCSRADIARRLPDLGLAPLSRSTVSRLLGRHVVQEEPVAPIATPSPTTATTEEDAELLRGVDEGLGAGGYLSDVQAVVVKKEAARKLRAIVADANTPAAVVVRASAELVRLIDAIRTHEKAIDEREDGDE